KIFERMKRSLIRVAQAAHVPQAFEGKTFAVLHFDPDLAIGFEIGIELGGVCPERGKEKAIEPPEVARDGLGGLNLLDAINRRRLAFIELPRGAPNGACSVGVRPADTPARSPGGGG